MVAKKKNNSMKHKHIIAIALLTILLVTAQPGKIRAGIIWSIISGISTEPTQIMNNLELLGINNAEWTQVAQQLEQLAHELAMIENQLKNLLTLVDVPLAFINTLEQLSQVVQQGQILSYTALNVDAQYANMYPGYAVYRNQDVSSAVLRQKYVDWSQHNMDNIKAALKASGIQEQTILNEQKRLNTIVDLSKSAEGRLQAVQAGNLIAAEQVSSLQRLRQLVMTNNQLMANYQAKEQDKEDLDAPKWEQSMGAETTDTTDGQSMLNINF